MKRVVIIGAGIGGLTTAAVLARAGLDVTVLEAQVMPGGCASTFYHQGYRFDTGATLSAGFSLNGPMDLLGQAAGIVDWPAHRAAETAMLVHLPGGVQVARYAGPERWHAYQDAFGSEALDFFRWQEETADALWNLAQRQPAWPIRSIYDALAAGAAGLPWLAENGFAALRRSPLLALDALRPLAARMRNSPEALRLFIDGQLLISAQTTSQHANALYSAAALDLPRRGVAHLQGGIGAIAERLVQAVRQHGGQVLFRQQATRILREGDRPTAVETKRGANFPADLVIANLTPWNAAELLGTPLNSQPDGWGAFVVYVGLDGTAVRDNSTLHHQVIRGRPMGEGNTVFASLSPEWDASRAPAGQRALTLSTHTDLRRWWQVYEQDREQYQALKQQYTGMTLAAAEVAIPGLRDAARLVLPGTPVTFQRYTRRALGWVGGFPQTSLTRAAAPSIAPNIWLVGDSIFPGQSTAAVALGGLRVARQVLRAADGAQKYFFAKQSPRNESRRLKTTCDGGKNQ